MTMAGDNSDASSMNNGHTMPNNRDKSIRLTPNTKLSGPGLLRIGRFKFRAKTDDLPQFVVFIFLILFYILTCDPIEIGGLHQLHFLS